MYFNDEIVTYPAGRASGKIVTVCGFHGRRPDILGDDAPFDALGDSIAETISKSWREEADKTGFCAASLELARRVLLSGRMDDR
jgi:hypothetical protein